MALLDPDPYWEYRSGSTTVKMASIGEKIQKFQVEKSIDLLMKAW